MTKELKAYHTSIDVSMMRKFSMYMLLVIAIVILLYMYMYEHSPSKCVYTPDIRKGCRDGLYMYVGGAPACIQADNIYFLFMLKYSGSRNSLKRRKPCTKVQCLALSFHI